MGKNTKNLLCIVMVMAIVLTLVACGNNGQGEETVAQPEIITDTGAGDNEKQLAALTALNALRAGTEEARLTELQTQLPVCPFC